MKNVALHNLGCKVNAYEMEVMQQNLISAGYSIVPFDQLADIYIVNTCTVTNIADRKSRQMLHRAKQLNPEAIVVAVGCYVQTAGEKILKDECIDLAVGNNRKKDIVEILDEYIRDREANGFSECGSDKTLSGTTIYDLSKPSKYEEMTLQNTVDHTRAYIKIQDGCNQFCSYCAIPLARGRVRSRRQEDIITEIQGLVAKGYKEIVLTGIHISSYGIDQTAEGTDRGDYGGQSKVVELVAALNEIPGLERIRLGSLEPRIITEENARILGSLNKVCPHFHLSLQSGCADTLKRMNRHYSPEEYLEAVERLRAVFDKPAITTDVIVGFPGETEDEFRTTVEFLKKVHFFEMHIFRYSKRAGTRAAVMKDQIPDPVKATRSNELLELEKAMSLEFRKEHIGKPVEVLLEETTMDGAYWMGHTRDYVRVMIPVKGADTGLKSNTLVTVVPTGMFDEDNLLV